MQLEFGEYPPFPTLVGGNLASVSNIITFATADDSEYLPLLMCAMIKGPHSSGLNLL